MAVGVWMEDPTGKCSLRSDSKGDFSSCEGDFCIAVRRSEYEPDLMRCISGVEKPSIACALNYYDEMMCFCDTDMCNNATLFLGNITVIPVVECRSVKNREYQAAACNQCVRKVQFINYTVMAPDASAIREIISCGGPTQSNDFIYGVETGNPLAENFFPNGCYNTTMHPRQYTVYCRCRERYCNSPEADEIPYPIGPPRVSCYRSGMDFEMETEKYMNKDGELDYSYRENVANDSFYDEGMDCRGHFCFIAAQTHENPDGEKTTHFSKGCISANESGDTRIALGYMRLNQIDYYFCNSDYCNSDIENTLLDARNSTLAGDNGAQKPQLLLHFLFGILILHFYNS